MPDGQNQSAGSVISDTLNSVSSLVRSEVDLARAEVEQNLKRAGVAIGLLVGAVVVALTALNVLSAAIVAGLAEAGLDAGWAALIVGAVFGVVAFAMIKKGTHDLKLSSIAPSRTTANMKRDAQTVKETLNA